MAASGSSLASSFSNFRPNPNVPIPNNPFYYPESSFLRGDQGQLIVGSGLNVDYATGIISASGGGGGGAVNQVTGGTGISVSPTTGNVVVSNTGVLQVTAGTGITVSGSKTNYTISSAFNGTVTSVTAGTGLTGGVITSSGTVAVDGNVVMLKSLYTGKGQLLVSTAAGNVTPLSSGGFPNGYSLVLDSTAATGMKWSAPVSAVQSVAGTAPVQVTAGANPVVSIAIATTTQQGATTLVNDVATNDSTKALTAAQGFALQQQINGLTGAGGLTLAGTLNASTGFLVTVTASGAGEGFTVGAALPAPAPANADYFVIATTSGSYDPPGAGGPYTVTQGDWFNSTGTAWDYLNVGFDAPAATTTVAGVVCLATDAEAILGSDSTKALTPLTGKCAYVPLACLAAKGSLVSASSALTPAALAVGTDGQVLTACAACISGLTWAPATLPAIPCACITGKGSLISGTSANNPVALDVGTNGQFLTVDSTAATGLAWSTLSLPYIACSCITDKGALITGTAASTPTALPVGSDGQILTANSLAASGLCWLTSPYIPCSIVTAKGGLIGATASGTPAFTDVAAANGCLLASNSACTAGLEWVAPPAAATPFVQGLVKGCTTASNTFLGCLSGITAGATDSTLIGSNIFFVGLPIASCCDTFVGIKIAAAPGVYRAGQCNTALGACALYNLANNAKGNTAIGAGIHSVTGCTLSGCNNLILASGAGINAPSLSGNCQLAIGFSDASFPQVTCYWMTGCSDKTIRPGAGILDCTGSAGLSITSGNFNVLASEGTAGVQWVTLPLAKIAQAGVFYGCETNGLALGLNAGALSFSSSPFCSNCALVIGNNTAGTKVDVSCSTILGTRALGTGGCSIACSTVIGTFAMQEAANANTVLNTVVGFRAACTIEGSCNTVVGSCAMNGLPYSGTNNTVIGFCAAPSAINSSNSITLGNSSITTIRAAVTTITSLSDARDKDNIRALPLGIEFLRDIKPVQFTWKQREANPVKDGTAEAGFIAQQLQEAVQTHNAEFLGLVDEENPNRLEVAPGKLIPILVKAIQDLADSHEKLREDFNQYRATHP
jgi:hypothetical protein